MMQSKRKLLIIDDDADLSLIISDMLTDKGFEVTLAPDSKSAYEILTTKRFDLILLDINLPDALGFDVCRELRRMSDVPVIFASARTSETDRISGLDIGGDDYIAKPFSLRELFSRINALLRRTYGFEENNKSVKFGGVTVDIGARTVTKNGQPVNLSLKEFDLLSYLCEHSDIAIAKDKLLSEVWGAFSDVAPTTLAVHMRWLREKLEDDPADPRYLKTVYKMGYILETKN